MSNKCPICNQDNSDEKMFCLDCGYEMFKEDKETNLKEGLSFVKQSIELGDS